MKIIVNYRGLMEFNRIICVYKTLVGFLVVIGQKRYQRNVSELFTDRS